MRKFLLITIFLQIAVVCNCQELTFQISPTLSNIFHYRLVSGGASGNARLGFTTCFEFCKSSSDKVSYGFGITYQYCRVEIIPEPFLGIDPHLERVHLFSGSGKLIINLKNEFYLSTDPLLDIQFKYNSQNSIENQSGIGLSFGIGKKVRINDKILIRFEPRLWVHNIIPFIDKNLPNRLTVFGINSGITIR